MLKVKSLKNFGIKNNSKHFLSIIIPIGYIKVQMLLKNVNQKIYGLLQDAQNKANELLSRFNLKVSVTADYACSNSENESE